MILPFSVAIELIPIARRRRASCVEILGGLVGTFLVEREEVLFIAAEALDRGEVGTVFDAIHLAEAQQRGVFLHTADEELLRTSFPTTRF